MMLGEHAVLMAAYNRWMNEKVYATAATLSPQAISENRGAFFGSIIGTLNHLLIADQIWLHRFSSHPSRFAALDPIRTRPRPLDVAEIVHDRLPPLRAEREALDAMIETWVAELSDSDLDHVLVYGNTKGVISHRRFGSLLMHLFNHQTHHRGQVTTLLTQAGVDVGSTDLLTLIENVDVD